MGFLDKLRQFLVGTSSGTSSTDPHGLLFHFRCDRCGSVVRIRVDRRNDLNREEGPGTFLLRKEVMDNKCFQLMSAEIWLDSSYNVTTADISGGELISKEEFEAAQQAQVPPA